MLECSDDTFLWHSSVSQRLSGRSPEGLELSIMIVPVQKEEKKEKPHSKYALCSSSPLLYMSEFVRVITWWRGRKKILQANTPSVADKSDREPELNFCHD